MRKTLRASVLVLALAFSVQAGEILTPPAPQSSTATVEQPTGGEIPTPPGVALTLLASVLSLF